MNRDVDVSNCQYLDVEFKFFKEFHYCSLASDEEDLIECENCGNCYYKLYKFYEAECSRLKRKKKNGKVKKDS